MRHDYTTKDIGIRIRKISRDEAMELIDLRHPVRIRTREQNFEVVVKSAEEHQRQEWLYKQGAYQCFEYYVEI